MTTETYGDHAERAADALDHLLRATDVPIEDDQITDVLLARQAVTDAIRDRLRRLGYEAPSAPPTPTASVPDLGEPTLQVADQELGRLLARVAHELPRLTADDRSKSPVELLGSAAVHPAVDGWAIAGRELLAANHILDAAAQKPWLTEPAAHWRIVADTGLVLEAVSVLDERLEEVGLFAGRMTTPDGDLLPRQEARILTGHAARVGEWYGDHATTDLAFAGNKPDAGPAHTIHKPGDFALAQRQLGLLLESNRRSGVLASVPRMDAQLARAVIANQTGLLAQLRQRVRSNALLRDAVGERLTRVSELLADTRLGLRSIQNVAPRRPNGAALWQQAEIANRLRTRGGFSSLSDAQVVDLVDATETTLGTFGSELRKEARRPDTHLRVVAYNRSRQLAPVSIGRKSSVDRCLSALAEYRPAPSAGRLLEPAARQNLQRTLSRTALERRAPTITPTGTTSPDRRRRRSTTSPSLGPTLSP